MLQEVKVNHIYQGSVLEVLKEFPDNIIDCIVTSPPYYGLRSYGTEPQVWDNHNGCKHDFKNMKSKKINLQAGNPEFKRKWREEATGESSNGYCSLCNAWYGELGQEPNFNMYIDHLVEIFMECRRVLKPTGSMWINIADSYGGSGNGTHDNTNNQNDKQLYLKQNNVNSQLPTANR